MEEMSSIMAVTFSLGNPMGDNPGVTSHVEITRLKLVTDAANLLSDPGKIVTEVSASDGEEISKNPDEDISMEDSLPENGHKSDSASDVVVQENEDDEVLPVVEDSNAVISEGLLVVDTGPGISLPNAVEIENGRVLAKAIILGESSIEEVPTAEVLIANPDLKIPDTSDLKASEVVIRLPSERNLNRGNKSVFELDCIPLWGSVSICGRRREMEDAVSVLPHFTKIPVTMLLGDHVIDEMNQNLTHLTGHFYGVYDGHGGSEVANYCRKRVHFALAEEIETTNDGFSDRSRSESRQAQWEKTFTRCFQKVDDEIGGIAKGVGSDGGDASDVTNEPVSSEMVGSTAVVALVCSSHIIVANCGDSRAVLYRGKQAIALSVDHKPSREDECARIEAAGGKVIVWKGARVFGVLAMSRSIGDRYLKPWIIPEPEVMFVPRAREDECLVIASDGLWDVMTNEEVCEVARKRILMWHRKNRPPSLAERGKGIDPAAQAAAEFLSNAAIQKGSEDNISVIVVDLKAQRKLKSRS